MTTTALTGKHIAFLATDGVEEEEFTAPWTAVQSVGAIPELISINPGTIQSTTHGTPGRTFPVDHLITDVTPRTYAALVLPGGVKNPDTLRQNPDAVKFVAEFMELDKPIAAICHGPWLLVEANTVRGRTLTSYPSLKTDIQNAGGTWVNKQVQIDQRLITSRTPADLPAFCKTLIASITDAVEERTLDQMVEQSFPASDPLPGPTSI